MLRSVASRGEDGMASKAMSVAAYFIGAVNRDEGDVMTHLRLQKLLYYAQGFSLAILDRPLFEDEIQAWKHGPVVPSVYQAFQGIGYNPIEPSSTLSWDDLDDDEIELLGDVWAVYGRFSATSLADMTHNEPPWKEAKLREVIPHDAMRRFFVTLVE